MKNIIIILIIISFLNSCKSSNTIVVKKTVPTQNISEGKSPVTTITLEAKTPNTNFENPTRKETSIAMSIVDYAKQFNGVRYRFGGTTAEGMDCSGLVFETFRAFNIILPRISRDMAKQGEKVTLENTQEGDLLFFKNMNRRNDISHVGLVVTIENGDIQFIHSSTTAGVIISKLSEPYWDKAFVEARRIL